MSTTLCCKKCGDAVPDGARFCSSCGLNISGEDPASVMLLIDQLSTPQSNFQLDSLRKATIGEYDILDVLGQGGMACVYLAHEISLDRKVAIKVMAPELKARPDMAQRFVLEARTAAKLSHPNIIPIYAVRETDDLLFFVMKCIVGQPLDELICASGPMDVAAAVEILSQVAGGLEYAHRKGVVHRDIKPANIILDDEGWAIVTDFGIAKVAHSAGLTMTGATIGTPSYMSPEQCAGGDISGQSDQYSLGVVAYEMLTGTLPFSSTESVVQIIWAHFNQVPEDLRELRNDCPDKLAEIVMRMLAKKPEDRWPSLAETAAALAEVAGVDSAAGLDSTSHSRNPMSNPISRFRTPLSPIPATIVGSPENEVTAVTVSPPEANVFVESTFQLSASVCGATGNVLTDRPLSWRSENPDIASVSSSGVVTGIVEGTASIVAVTGGVRGTASVQVRPVPVAAVRVVVDGDTMMVGGKMQLAAQVLDFNENQLERPVTWAVSDPEIARVNPDGLLHAFRDGVLRVTANSQGIAGAAEITIVPVPVGSLILREGAASVSVGEVTEIEAVAVGVGGGELSDRVVEWESSDRVTSPTVVSLKVDPVELELGVGMQSQLRVLAVTSNGQEIDVSADGWKSSNPSIIRVTDDGLVAGLRTGSAKVAVQAAGRRAVISIYVLSRG